jgi:hypothetical protein
MVAMRIVQVALREGTRVSGMSGQQYAANALARVDPRVGFSFPSIARAGGFSVLGSAEVACTGSEFRCSPRPLKKVKKMACLIPYDINMVLKA